MTDKPYRNFSKDEETGRILQVPAEILLVDTEASIKNLTGNLSVSVFLSYPRVSDYVKIGIDIYTAVFRLFFTKGVLRETFEISKFFFQPWKSDVGAITYLLRWLVTIETSTFHLFRNAHRAEFDDRDHTRIMLAMHDATRHLINQEFSWRDERKALLK